jgi:hypothetical protein
MSAVMLTFSHDISPLFGPHDISCMVPHGVLLNNSDWMCTPANAQKVYAAVAAKRMPPGQPWPPDRLALFKAWMDGGYKP